ncbi:MAG: helix-turn-helix domain-containing protein [Solirubrobacterales bacterium]
MLHPEFAKWNQSVADIRRLVVEADHKRSRERFEALYQIGSGQSNATQWAQSTNRNERTVMNWIHLYNAQGPAGMHYQHSGGRTPFLANRSRQRSLPR